MRNAQSYVIASLPLCCIYLFYTHIYGSYKLLQSKVVDYNKGLPSFGFLLLKYFFKALCGKHNHPDFTARKEVTFSVLNCRLESLHLRRFCSAAGYGWDYPDSEYRDIPLCFPEVLCLRLMFMVLTADNFKLSPMGLTRVRQRLKTLQPIDELKKGPFILQAQVLVYRHVGAGVEVDISLSATSQANQLVWESVMTMLSRNNNHKATRSSLTEDCDTDGPLEPDNVRNVEMTIPWSTGLKNVWAFSDYSPHRLLLSLPFKTLGLRYSTYPCLWMLSVCLAEIEKHRGVEAVRAPVSISAQFKEPLSVPGRVVIKFWETTPMEGHSSPTSISFKMLQPGTRITHSAGLICRN